ncbi:MAG: hypothetical protein GY711_00685 [bacterium]|nr:hypothetical protein [bacterium]
MSDRFVVTGCGRSGTGYTSGLITQLGLPCGHERVFNPYDLLDAEVFWPPNVPGDSSWLAAPLLGYLESGTRVLHQVRDPLAVVRSLVRTRFFDDPSLYRDFAEQLCPELAQGSAVERSARYWVSWNRMVEEQARSAGLPYMRYRLEDYSPELVRQMTEFLQHEASTERITAALANHPTDFNTRGDKSHDEEIVLEALDPNLENQLTHLASHYGYTPAHA